MYALENDAVLDSTTGTGGGDAGVFVKVSNGDFNKEPVEYQTNSYLGETSYPFLGTTAMYPEVNLKVTGASSGEFPLGITLNQTAKKDENGEKLLYNPTKQTELQAVLPGPSVPVATKGIFTLAAAAFDGTASLYPVGSGIRISTNNVGKITGTHPSNANAFGTVIGTGSRTSQGPTTDQFAGEFLVVKFDCQ